MPGTELPEPLATQTALLSDFWRARQRVSTICSAISGMRPSDTDVTVLLRMPTSTRLLANWTMARVDLSDVASKAPELINRGDNLGIIALLMTLAHQGETDFC